jgi:hypothetical protein
MIWIISALKIKHTAQLYSTPPTEYCVWLLDRPQPYDAFILATDDSTRDNYTVDGIDECI